MRQRTASRGWWAGVCKLVPASLRPNCTDAAARRRPGNVPVAVEHPVLPDGEPGQGEPVGVVAAEAEEAMKRNKRLIRRAANARCLRWCCLAEKGKR